MKNRWNDAGRDALLFALVLVLGIGYIVWLDYGCELTGIMTWEGKVCM